MIKLNYEDEQILIQASGQNFMDQIESIKGLGSRYDAKRKIWSIGVSKYKKVLEELSIWKIDISEWDKIEINKYFSGLEQLKIIKERSKIRKYNPELLLMQPLKDFQLIDTSIAMNRNRYLFAWSTGLGKSWALSTVYQHLKHAGEVNKAIILTSSIGTLNLGNELKKFIPNYDASRTLVIGSITQLKDRLIFKDEYDIIIMGYDSFRAIGDAYDKNLYNRKKKVKYRKSPLPLEEWFGDKKGIIFLDECHLLGSPNSLRSKFLNMNLHFFEYLYQFSATPSDKEEKMYMILKVLDKKLVNGEDYLGWCEQFCELGNRWSKYGINKETWNHQKWAELQDVLYKDYAVKRGKELLNLPTAYDVPLIKLPMSKSHREIYEAFSYEVINDVKNRNSQNHAGLVANLTNMFSYLQLAVDNPLCLLTTPSFEKFPFELQDKIRKFNFEKDFEKLKALDLIIEEECVELGNKIIISYHHPKTLECLKAHLKKGYHVLSADVPKDQRFKVIEDFKLSDDKILLASINIANTSFTLTECKAAVLFERCWMYIIYEQFRGRIYRIGQEDEVRYYNMVYDYSIDNLQLRALETKGLVMENLIKKNTLSQDEWKMIFNANEDNLDFLTN